MKEILAVFRSIGLFDVEIPTSKDGAFSDTILVWQGSRGVERLIQTSAINTQLEMNALVAANRIQQHNPSVHLDSNVLSGVLGNKRTAPNMLHKRPKIQHIR